MTVKLILERKSMKNFPNIEIRRKVVEVEIPGVDNLEQEEKGVWEIMGYAEVK